MASHAHVFDGVCLPCAMKEKRERDEEIASLRNGVRLLVGAAFGMLRILNHSDECAGRKGEECDAGCEGDIPDGPDGPHGEEYDWPLVEAVKKFEEALNLDSIQASLT